MPDPYAIPVLTFHKVDPRFEWGVTRITPRRFEKILDYLKAKEYQTVSFATLSEKIKVMRMNPIVLTFDDSYESIHSNALPLMQSHGFVGTIFVITGYVEKLNTWDVNLGGLRFSHLTWDQIHELNSAGWEIASHTVTHPDLTRVDGARLQFEVQKSKEVLEDRFGISVQSIAFPFGIANEIVIEACLEAGYTYGVGCRLSREMKNSKEMVVIGRKAYYLFDKKWNLDAKLGINGWAFVEDLKLQIINACSRGSSWVKPPRAVELSDFC